MVVIGLETYNKALKDHCVFAPTLKLVENAIFWGCTDGFQEIATSAKSNLKLEVLVEDRNMTESEKSTSQMIFGLQSRFLGLNSSQIFIWLAVCLKFETARLNNSSGEARTNGHSALTSNDQPRNILKSRNCLPLRLFYALFRDAKSAIAICLNLNISHGAC